MTMMMSFYCDSLTAVVSQAITAYESLRTAEIYTKCIGVEWTVAVHCSNIHVVDMLSLSS